MDLLATTAAFHITDLQSLDYLAQNQPSTAVYPTSYELAHAVIPLLKTLSITSQLPLRFFEAVSSQVTAASDFVRAAVGENLLPQTKLAKIGGRDKSSVWLQMWPALAVQLRQLQTLHLWLDHDGPTSWSFVDERAVLSPLFSAISPETLLSLKEVSVNLPNLHPRYEKPEYHFTRFSAPPPAHTTLRRRLRQIVHCRTLDSGDIEIIEKGDFPLLLEFIGVEEWGFGNVTTRPELETWEREAWDDDG